MRIIYGDDCHGREVLSEPEPALPSGQHRLGRAQRRCRQEVRPGGLVPRLRSLPRAGVLQQLH